MAFKEVALVLCLAAASMAQTPQASFQVRKYTCRLEALVPTTTTISTTTKTTITSTYVFNSQASGCPNKLCPLSYAAFQTAINSADNARLKEVIGYYYTPDKAYPDQTPEMKCQINELDANFDIPKTVSSRSPSEINDYCMVMNAVRAGLPQTVPGCLTNQVKIRPEGTSNDPNGYYACINATCFNDQTDQECIQSCVRSNGVCTNFPTAMTEFQTCVQQEYQGTCTPEGYSPRDFDDDSNPTPPPPSPSPPPPGVDYLGDACQSFHIKPNNGFLWDDIPNRVDSGECQTLTYYYECGLMPEQLFEKDLVVREKLSKEDTESIAGCAENVDIHVCCGHTGVVELDNSDCADNVCSNGGPNVLYSDICVPMKDSAASVRSAVAVLFVSLIAYFSF